MFLSQPAGTLLCSYDTWVSSAEDGHDHSIFEVPYNIRLFQDLSDEDILLSNSTNKNGNSISYHTVNFSTSLTLYLRQQGVTVEHPLQTQMSTEELLHLGLFH